MHVPHKACLLFMMLLPAFSHHLFAEGQMLKFDGQPNLDILPATTTDKAGILYQSSFNEITAEPFSRILFNGVFEDENIGIDVQYRLADGRLSEWQATFVKRFDSGRFWARLDIEGEMPRQIRYRLVSDMPGTANRIQIYAVEGVAEKWHIGHEGEHEVEAPAAVKFAQTDTIVQPPIVTRTEWGANAQIGAYIPHDPFRLTQHHTAGGRVATLSEGIAEMQFIQDFHQNGRGWQDIGYHFCIDDSGRIYQGVPTDFRGTHVGGNNTGNVGISYMGNLHISGESPTAAAIDRLKDIWSWLSFTYNVTPDSLFGHRDYNATACPGDNLYSQLPALRNGVRQQLGFGAPYVGFPSPQPFAQEVDPNAQVRFQIFDAEEGVDESSIVVRVNGDTIAADISGSASVYTVTYNAPAPYPNSQNVTVTITADDLASPPNSMSYEYEFRIIVAALAVEVTSASSLRNANLELEGVWDQDFNGVSLSGLTTNRRLLTIDTDGSHRARIYPSVTESGDYNVLLASNTTFLGESAGYQIVSADDRLQPHYLEYNSVNLDQWGPLSPTPVHFVADSDSGGYIELQGLSDIETRLVIDALRFEKIDRLDPPSQPTLKWVRKTDATVREVEIAWYPSLEGDIAGYRIFSSNDGLTWGDPFVDETVVDADETSYVYTADESDSKFYFRVIAVDTNRVINENGSEEPLLSPPTDAYGIGFESDASILVVDNFDRQASWQAEQHPFVASYGDAIDANGHGFESCTETAVQNGDIHLSDYEVVMYFCGDDSRADESLAAVDQFRIQDYLEAGGKLFMNGSELGYDFAATTATELIRYRDLMKALYVGDLAGSNRVIGQAGTVFEGLDFTYGTTSSNNNYIEDFPDYIQPFGGSQTCLYYDNLRIAGVQYTGTYGTSSETAQLVYLGFTFETINVAAQRTNVMESVLRYFDIIVGIEADEPIILDEFRLSQNYPNPFNPTTAIEYFIPTSNRGQTVYLDIFNTLGQRVRTLVKEKQTPGAYNIEWDARDDAGLPVASGVYFYQLRVGELSESRKMILMR